MLDTTLVAVSLPEESDQSENQRQTVEYIVPFVVLEILRKQFLVAYKYVIYERDTGDPVAVFYLPATLYVILPSGKVPHEITPVHEVQLVGEEEFDIFPLGRYIYHYHFPALVVWHIMAFHVHPLLVKLGV